MQTSGFLDALEVQANALRASRQDLALSFTRGPLDREKTGAWLEITAPQRLAQFTVWSSGECELEADASDGSVLLRRSLVLDSPSDLGRLVEELLSFLP
jgi:hypothetical protein